jgi:putative DNA primase/helicase
LDSFEHQAIQIRELFDNQKPKNEIQAKMASAILTAIPIKTIAENEQIIWWDTIDGYWKPRGEQIIHQVARKILSYSSRHFVNEVIDKIRTLDTSISIEELNPKDIVSVQNGVLVFNGSFQDGFEFKKHSPEYLVTQRIPVIYDPEAFCENIEIAFAEWTDDDNIKILEEAIGYCLTKEYPYHTAFIILGPTYTGKSTFLRLLKQFLGADNISAVNLQQLTKNDFYVHKLFGKLANISPDLPSKAIYNTGQFKALTGEDMVTANIKHGKIYEFLNFAKFFFSTNEIPPSAHDETDAYYGRWIIIEFPKQFLDKDKDPQLLKKLTTPNELSGLLNRALEGLRRLSDRGQFESKLDFVAKKTAYLIGSDTVKAFYYEYCELDPVEWLPKQELFEEYLSFCEQRNRNAKGKAWFTKGLREWSNGLIIPTKKNIDEKRTPIYQGVRLKFVS